MVSNIYEASIKRLREFTNKLFAFVICRESYSKSLKLSWAVLFWGNVMPRNNSHVKIVAGCGFRAFHVNQSIKVLEFAKFCIAKLNNKSNVNLCFSSFGKQQNSLTETHFRSGLFCRAGRLFYQISGTPAIILLPKKLHRFLYKKHLIAM